jgi:hypothetical protein
VSAERLREAAALMRERAEAADALGQVADTITTSSCEEFAEHIASWHPVVALAVAKAMDDVADAWEIADGWALDLDDDPIRFEDTIDGGWLAVATAYLGGDL